MRYLKWMIIILFSLITIVPFLWLIFASLKTNSDLFANPFAIPDKWAIENYLSVLSNHPIPRYFLNSIIVALGSTVLGVVITTLAAYIFFFKFKFKSRLFALLAFGIMVPTNAFMVPYYFIVEWLGLYDSLLGVALVYTAISLPLSFIIIKTYMDTIPYDILEAAYIDGASIHQIFIKIILPLVYPAMITASILLIITGWNELLFANLLTQSEGTRTLQVAIRFFLSTFQANYAEAFAAMVIAIVPTIVVYIFLSDKIIKGLTAGSVKS